MRLASTIIVLISISIQSSIAQVTYEPDQITSKSKKIKEDKIKKDIDFGFTIGAKQCIINKCILDFSSLDSTNPVSIKPKPGFNFSNFYFTTSFELNEKMKLYANLGLQRNSVKMNFNQQEFSLIESIYQNGQHINFNYVSFNKNGSISFKKIDIAFPIICSYKLNSKLNLELGANYVLSFPRNRYYLVNNDVNYYLATSFFRGTKLKALGSVCYNIKPNTQLRVLIDTQVGLGNRYSWSDFRVNRHQFDTNLQTWGGQSTSSRFTYLNFNFTQLF